MVSWTSHTGPGRNAPKSGATRASRSRDAIGPRIFLVRHGRTSLNAAGVLRGRLDPELDVTGLVEAVAVADAIGRSDLSVLVSSPLQRSVDTAAQIGARAGLEVETDERLIDRDYGSWAGKPKSDVIAQWGSLDAAPDVEPSAEVYARAMDAFNDVANRIQSGSAAIVTHDAVLQVLLPALDPGLMKLEPIPLETGSFNVIERMGGTWQATSVNVSPSSLRNHPPAGDGHGE